jgi:murein DD-endopeptidase MepM/ murein hydrolase activator NlpD
VVYSGYLSGYGYVVYINSYVNGQYIQTRYGHLACQADVYAGDTVKAGQTIGYMGASGNAEGVHLHFEVRIRASSGTCIANADSTAVDPFNYTYA